MGKVKKAIIPVAGLGTRFLPVTKVVPKELLPIVDTPILCFIVEEAFRAGIEDIILIQGRGKSAIEDFFDTSYELEDNLARSGRQKTLESLKHWREMVRIVSIRQREPLGLGHAVSLAETLVGNEPFAVMLGDEIMVAPNETEDYGLAMLIKDYTQVEKSVVGVMNVPAEEVSRYGIAAIEDGKDWPRKVKAFVEKPTKEKAPSTWALPGRYVFTPQIFEHLKSIKPGKNGELQLTDAMDLLAKNQGVYVRPLNKGQRYDAGDKLGFLQANIELGLRHPELGDNLKKYLKTLVAGLD